MSTEVLSQLGVGITIIDQNLRIRYVNKIVEEIFNLSASSMIGKLYNDFTLPLGHGQKQTKKKVFPAIDAISSGIAVQETVELSFDDQEPFKLLYLSTPLRNSTKKIIGAIDVCLLTEKFSKTNDINVLFPILRKYISNKSWDHIMATFKNRVAPMYAKCFVTMAFIDIVGFSSIAEKLDPHQTVSMLNVFFHRVHRTISRYKGDIDKYLGDAVLATFFNAEAAVRCFTEILLVDLPIINSEVRKISRKIDNLSVHIGINSGWVILGEIGASSRKELTVIGDDVNTAARIQALTPPNEIWISGRTVANLGDFKKLLTEADYIKVKGKTLMIKNKNTEHA